MPAPFTTRHLLAAVLFGALVAASNAAPTDPLAWPVPTRTARPWTRWWWLGSAVDAGNLQRLLTDYRNAGIGGVEICPIYGAKGYEKRFIDFLSPEWMNMLSVTVRTAAGLDLGVDMTTGTGWPMGGPWVPADQASQTVLLRRFPIGPSTGVPEFMPKSPLQREPGPGRNDGMVVGLGEATLLCLEAKGPDGSQVDLTDRVRGGRLDWTPPGAGWTLYALTARQPVQKVKRAAPGGAGNVVDPFSEAALDTYLARFDRAFKGYGGPMPRAEFQDSFEYFGANWTPGFLGEFARRRGYDLRKHLAELAGDDEPDAASRVREDYRRTISELHLAYVEHWTAWSHSRGSLTREQAHGAPANIEDVYAAADIPETEAAFGGGSEDQVPMLKFASSAAHVTGRKLASSETFTWLGEHFKVPLSQLKPMADMLFLAGINHMFFHGIPYSPADAPWPGWLFYASVNFGPNGGLWHDLPAFNAYATRCQSVLQSGWPDNDVLLYFPVTDYWQRIRPAPQGASSVIADRKGDDPLVEQFTTPGKWMGGTPFHETAMELWHRGYGFDEVTDALLAGARVDAAAKAGPGGGIRGIALGGNHYGAVVIPPCRFMPVETLRRLIDLARGGAVVVFAGDIPSDVPGLADLGARRAKFRDLLGDLPPGILPRGSGSAAGAAPAAGVHRSALGAGWVLSVGAAYPDVDGGVAAALGSAAIPRETMTDDGLLCIRRGRDDGSDYFIVNTGGQRVEKWVRIARRASSAALLDPMFPHRAGVAATRPRGDGLEVFLQMAPGQSLILRTFDGQSLSGPAWEYFKASGRDPIELGGDWTIHFSEGGPTLPRDFHSTRLGSWTEEADPEAERFAGTAVYSLRFSLPQGGPAPHEWQLDLGRVGDSARVRLNGVDVATLWCRPFIVDVGHFLRPGENILEVEVTNLAANRIRDLDRRHVDWKSFYEINFVGRDYRAFDASGWPLRDSGLLGPVVLTPMESLAPQGLR